VASEEVADVEEEVDVEGVVVVAEVVETNQP